MPKKRRPTATQPAGPATDPPADADHRPPCPNCQHDHPERLKSHTAAGYRWTRYKCNRPGCGRVWIVRGPLDQPY